MRLQEAITDRVAREKKTKQNTVHEYGHYALLAVKREHTDPNLLLVVEQNNETRQQKIEAVRFRGLELPLGQAAVQALTPEDITERTAFTLDADGSLGVWLPNRHDDAFTASSNERIFEQISILASFGIAQPEMVSYELGKRFAEFAERP